MSSTFPVATANRRSGRATSGFVIRRKPLLKTLTARSTATRRGRSVPEGQDIEQGGCDREAREADKDDRNHGMPNENGVAAQGLADMLVLHHDHGPDAPGVELFAGRAKL